MTPRASRLLRIAAVVAFVLAAAALGRAAMRPAAPGVAEELEATAAPSRADAVAELRLVAESSAIRPNVLYAASGQPLRIVVQRRAAGPDRLAVPELGIAADLAPERETILLVPPTRRGAFPITDGAGKTIGALRVQ